MPGTHFAVKSARRPELDRWCCAMYSSIRLWPPARSCLKQFLLFVRHGGRIFSLFLQISFCCFLHSVQVEVPHLVCPILPYQNSHIVLIKVNPLWVPIKKYSWQNYDESQQCFPRRAQILSLTSARIPLKYRPNYGNAMAVTGVPCLWHHTLRVATSQKTTCTPLLLELQCR